MLGVAKGMSAPPKRLVGKLGSQIPRVAPMTDRRQPQEGGEYVAARYENALDPSRVNDLWVEANYRETQIGRMKVGDPVRIDVDTYPGRPLCGYVEAILPATDPNLR